MPKTGHQIPELDGPVVLPADGQAPRSLVIFLHGLGADGHDLIALHEVFADLLPHTVFMSPHAPFRYDMAPPGFHSGFQWFSLKMLDPISLNNGVSVAAPILEHNIVRILKEYNIPDNELILIGFSQGTMLALEVGLRRKIAPKAIIGFSGALIGEERLSKDIKSKPPVCLIHGQDDPVVPFACMGLAHDALTKNGVPVEAHPIPDLPHGINDQAIDFARNFMQKHCV